MLPRRELNAFRKELLNWFQQFRRELPWRNTHDAYRIWVSEVMLQQTRVAAVIPYYEHFLERFPDMRSLAEAPEAEVLRLWAGLGYYSRARNLQKAAQQIVALHSGEFPQDEKAAHALPGIGSYTSAAILSIAFGKKHAVLDGNVARVLARLGAIRGDLRETKRWQSLQKTAIELLYASAPGDWNQAMMELGATLCTPRAPQCLLCPVAKFCRARQLGDAESYPKKRKKRDTVDIVLAAAVFCDSQNRTLLLPPPTRAGRRPAADDIAALVSGMWHFPTVAASQEPLIELQKFLSEAMPAINGDVHFEPLAKVRHAVTYRKISVVPFRVALPKIPRVRGAKRILLQDLSTVPISNLTQKIARSALSHASPAGVETPTALILVASA